jgi:glycosyltransferase involved in cell wall biosynthesis
VAGNLNDVTAVTVNWRTLDLTLRCVATLLECYPKLSIIVVDNGSNDKRNSAGMITMWAKEDPAISAILNRKNWCDREMPMPPVGQRETPYGLRRVLDTQGEIHEPFLVPGVLRKLYTGGNVGHGPALHQVLKLCKTPYLLALDSDCIIQRAGFIEIMLEPFSDSSVYAVGRQVKLDRRGTRQPPRPGRRGSPHIHEAVIILDVAKYHMLEPYVHYGVPSLLNMPSAIAKGYTLENYHIGPKDSAVHHLFRGSRKRTGSMPNVRSIPIMPNVLLDGLQSEFIGGYF